MKQCDAVTQVSYHACCLRLGSPWVTRNSIILFIAPMKKMRRSCVIAMVMRLHRKIGEQTELRNGGEPAVKGKMVRSIFT